MLTTTCFRQVLKMLMTISTCSRSQRNTGCIFHVQAMASVIRFTASVSAYQAIHSSVLIHIPQHAADLEWYQWEQADLTSLWLLQVSRSILRCLKIGRAS